MLKWWACPSKIADILAPIGWIYGGVTVLRRRFRRKYNPAVPVICIGNVTVGGAGKTPLALAVGDYFIKQGKNVVFLTRGYGGRLDKVTVDLSCHTSREVGDEAMLLASRAKTIVSRDRVLGVKLAESMKADLVIMDDGMQSGAITCRYTILAIDGGFGLGNGHMLPIGPLREPFGSAAAKATVLAIIGEDRHKIADRAKDLPVLTARLSYYPLFIDIVKRRKAIAFAGIGRPQKFFDALRDLKIDLVDAVSFPDHYVYQRKDLLQLLKQARAADALLITTPKDAVKIDPKFMEHVVVANCELVIDNLEILASLNV